MNYAFATNPVFDVCDKVLLKQDSSDTGKGLDRKVLLVLRFTFQRANNKGADQPARNRRRVCAFVVRMQHNHFLSRRGPLLIGT